MNKKCGSRGQRIPEIVVMTMERGGERGPASVGAGYWGYREGVVCAGVFVCDGACVLFEWKL